MNLTEIHYSLNDETFNYIELDKPFTCDLGVLLHFAIHR